MRGRIPIPEGIDISGPFTISVGEVLWDVPPTLRQLGIGDERCYNYDRICYVIERDNQRKELWDEIIRG